MSVFLRTQPSSLRPLIRRHTASHIHLAQVVEQKLREHIRDRLCLLRCIFERCALAVPPAHGCVQRNGEWVEDVKAARLHHASRQRVDGRSLMRERAHATHEAHLTIGGMPHSAGRGGEQKDRVP